MFEKLLWAIFKHMNERLIDRTKEGQEQLVQQ